MVLPWPNKRNQSINQSLSVEDFPWKHLIVRFPVAAVSARYRVRKIWDDWIHKRVTEKYNHNKEHCLNFLTFNEISLWSQVFFCCLVSNKKISIMHKNVIWITPSTNRNTLGANIEGSPIFSRGTRWIRVLVGSGFFDARYNRVPDRNFGYPN